MYIKYSTFKKLWSWILVPSSHDKWNSDKLEAAADFLFLSSKVNADGYCRYKIKRLFHSEGKLCQILLFTWKSMPYICDPMDCSTLDIPVLPNELNSNRNQTQVSWIHGDFQSSYLAFLTSNFPSTRVFSNELVLFISWPKYVRFSFNISPSSEYSGLISFRIHCIYFFADQGAF